MVFNRRLKEARCDPQKRPELDFFQHRIHDAWTACVASSIGVLIYDPRCHMSFRRHDSNATDAEIRRGRHMKAGQFILTYKSKIKRLISRGRINRNGVQLTAENLLKGYDKSIDGASKELLLLVSGYKKSIKKRIWLLFGHAIKTAVPESKWNIRIKILLNLL